MPPRCTPISAGVTPATGYPLWAMPDTLLAMSSWRVRSVTLTAGQVVAVCRADPLRIGLSIGTGGTLASGLAVGPTDRPDTGGFAYTSTTGHMNFTLFTFGPMVCAAWNGFSSSGTTVSVYEWYKLTGR